jgi:hypothetical protein
MPKFLKLIELSATGLLSRVQANKYASHQSPIMGVATTQSLEIGKFLNIHLSTSDRDRYVVTVMTIFQDAKIESVITSDWGI